ncbi:MAG: hypothetical protein NXY57DRAFT_1092279, partial [Lentinula lateritia]
YSSLIRCPSCKDNSRCLCMFPSSSRRLKRAQYLQSDIGFKRVVGLEEFEIAGTDPLSRISFVYCRVFLNRQSAEAHKLVFAAIDEIVLADTGSKLEWRHLHASNARDFIGLGLHLRERAKEFPNKYDVHETNRLLTTLSPYEHLHRIFRLCDVHFKWNIQKSVVSKAVKDKMRSLSCVTHPHFDQTVQEIAQEGGKVGADWVQDKIQRGFAFQAICWERNFIPKLIWQTGDATTNVEEGLHANINLDGIACTILRGIAKGHHFD